MFWHVPLLVRIEDAIDGFQGIKTNLTNRMITDPVLNAAAHRYISAQTVFAKMLISNTVDVVKYMLEHHQRCSSGKKD